MGSPPFPDRGHCPLTCRQSPCTALVTACIRLLCKEIVVRSVVSQVVQFEIVCIQTQPSSSASGWQVSLTVPNVRPNDCQPVNHVYRKIGLVSSVSKLHQFYTRCREERHCCKVHDVRQLICVHRSCNRIGDFIAVKWSHSTTIQYGKYLKMPL